MPEEASSRARVMVVEDEFPVSSMLEEALGADHYEVLCFQTLAEARAFLRRDTPDLAVLDRHLPDGNGIELCKEIRSDPRTRKLPVLFLTAQGGLADRIAGLDEGADDYLAKPFSPAELLARIRAVLRRTMAEPKRPAVLKAGPLRADTEARQAFLFDRELILRPKEYNLLVAFLESPGKALTRAHLLERAWGVDERLGLDTNVVDVTLGNLRRKLGDGGRSIVSVYSIGFRFDPELLGARPAPPHRKQRPKGR
jgi:DNA-binding response OmpR family regulator